MRSLEESVGGTHEVRRLLAHVADLKLEVARLRRHSHFVHRKVKQSLKRILRSCASAPEADLAPAALTEIARTGKRLARLMRELDEPRTSPVAPDRVIEIALRPLVEQIFRCQQRLQRAPQISLRLDLEIEHVEWFPLRLRHILDNLVSSALKYRDPDNAEAWVQLSLRASPERYELRVADNGVDLESHDRKQVFELFYPAAPATDTDDGVGLAVVKLLVEQSGGTLGVDSGVGQGTTFVVVLPRFGMDDFLQ